MAYQISPEPPAFDLPRAQEVAAAEVPPSAEDISANVNSPESRFQRGAIASEQARFAARRIAAKLR